MADARSLDEVRAVLQRHRESLTNRYKAVGTGIGKAGPDSDRYAIALYLPSVDLRPAQTVSVEGVELSFVVTGEIVPLRKEEG